MYASRFATSNVLSKNQLMYEKLVNKPPLYNPIVVVIGPAGSGKTFIACQAGINKLLNKEVKKLVITRPAICVDESHGYLPGDLNAKMHPYMKPIYDVFLEYVTMATLKSHIKNEVIEICPFSFLRGRTFNNCFVIADETQNTTKGQMQTLLTRIGDNCKTIVTGDLSQSDLKTPENGLSDLIERCERQYIFSDEICIDIVKFTDDDVIRSETTKKIIHLYSI
jgi:phosphate starvation-inducible PhoH-like protein